MLIWCLSEFIFFRYGQICDFCDEKIACGGLFENCNLFLNQPKFEACQYTSFDFNLVPL
jgi:hypothetical protein